MKIISGKKFYIIKFIKDKKLTQTKPALDIWDLMM